MIRSTAVVVAVAAAALAAAPAVAGGGHDGSFEFKIHGFYIINFVVFVGLIAWFGRKPLRAALDKRYADVAKEIEAAQAARAQAEARLSEYKAKVAELAAENERLLADVRAGTDAEVARILADARAEVDRTARDAELRLDQESKKLRDQLHAEAARLAVAVADRLVRQQLDAAAQARLVDAALADLEAMPADGAARGMG